MKARNAFRALCTWPDPRAINLKFVCLRVITHPARAFLFLFAIDILCFATSD